MTQFLRTLLFFLLLGIFVETAFADPDLLIHIPNGSPRKIAKTLSKELSIDVQAFGKIRDLKRSMKKYPTVPVIANGLFIEKQKSYQVFAHSLNKGKMGEHYLLVSTESSNNKQNTEDWKIGLFDIVGRKNVKELLKTAFNLDFKQVQRVYKKQDLLTILGMHSVDAIALPESDFKKMLKETKTTLTQQKKSSQLLSVFPVVAAQNRSNAKIVLSKLNNISKETLSRLGINQWRIRP